jgi:hypothetical protein
MMGKLSFRLDQPLLDRLQAEADARETTPSALGRQALQAYLDGHRHDTGTPPAVVTPGAAPPHDRDACAQTLLTMLPLEVRTVIVQKASLLGLPVSEVLKALLITHAWPSGRPSPQVAGVSAPATNGPTTPG